MSLQKLNVFDNEKATDMSYDKNFKKFFQRKEALAGILLNVVPEFAQSTHAEVMDRIITSEVNALNAELFSTEDVEQKQTILYDVVVKVNVAYQRRDVHLIFDLEMQRKYRPGYPLFNRMIYDLSRLIAKQDIENAQYQDLVPVQSTWICMKGVPAELQNRAFHFEFTPFEDGMVSNVVRTKFTGIDLVRTDLLLLSENYDWDENDPAVIKFLQSVFHNKMQVREFNPYVTMDVDVMQEVNAIMTENEKYEADLNAERAEARVEGHAEGLAEGIQSTLLKMITAKRKLHVSDDAILEELISIYGISLDAAKQLMNLQ